MERSLTVELLGVDNFPDHVIFFSMKIYSGFVKQII